MGVRGRHVEKKALLYLTSGSGFTNAQSLNLTEFKRQAELASQISDMVLTLQQFVNDNEVPSCLWDSSEILQVFTNNN